MRPGSFYTHKMTNEMILVLSFDHKHVYFIDKNGTKHKMLIDEYRDTFNSRAVIKKKAMKYEYLDKIYQKNIGFHFQKNGNIELIEKNYYAERSGKLDDNGKLIEGVPVKIGKPRQTSKDINSKIKYYIEYLMMNDTELSIELFDSKSRLHHIMNLQDDINFSTLQKLVETFKERSDEITNGEQILLISHEDIWK